MKKQLDISLLLGSIYFLIVSAFHFIGFKVPIIYIYYDVISTTYQDRIISVLSFVFSVFLYAGYQLKNKELTKYIIFAGTIGVLGLAVNNYLTRISFRNNNIYWIEIGLLGIYIGVLYLFFRKFDS